MSPSRVLVFAAITSIAAGLVMLSAAGTVRAHEVRQPAQPLLFPLGMLNIAILAIITAFILAEKTSRFGQQIALAGGVALIVYGAVVVAIPDALPITMDDSAAMEMPMGGEQMPLGGMPHANAR